MDIYWIDKNRQRKGPEPEVIIVTKLETGEISPDTMGWHKGCSGWLPIQELPALSSYFLEDEDPDEMGLNDELMSDEEALAREAQALSEIKTVLVTRPGLMVRLFARIFDYFLYMVVVLCLMTWFLKSPWDVYVDDRFRLFFWFPWIFIEAFFLKMWGTTPGKILCGIRVISLNTMNFRHQIPALEGGHPGGETRRNGELSFSQSLKRAIQVMFFGVFFLLGIMSIFAGLFSLYYIRKNGVSLWDKTNGTTEFYKSRTPMDWVIYIALFLGLLMICGHVVEPWVPSLPEIQEFLKNNQ